MQRPKIFMMFYDFPSPNYQRPHKKFNFPEKNYPPPPTPEKTSTYTSISPFPPPPLSDINNANFNAFEQLHKYQQCRKCKHFPPISPLSSTFHQKIIFACGESGF